MNHIALMGRLTRPPELRMTSNQTPVASFTLAVDRPFKSASGERQADFISAVAWRKTAELIAQYFTKGSKILIEGSLQIRQYEDKDGNNRTVAEVVVDQFHFVDSKQTQAPKNEYNPVQDDTDVPFDL